MPSRSSLSARERHLRSTLHALLSRASGFLHGSPIDLKRKCGKPTCQCASDDSKRHRSLSVGQTHEGKTTSLHIPKDMETEVRQWIDNYNTARDLLEALDQQSRERLRQRKQKRSRPGSKKTSPPSSPSSGES